MRPATPRPANKATGVRSHDLVQAQPPADRRPCARRSRPHHRPTHFRGPGPRSSSSSPWHPRRRRRRSRLLRLRLLPMVEAAGTRERKPVLVEALSLLHVRLSEDGPSARSLNRAAPLPPPIAAAGRLVVCKQDVAGAGASASLAAAELAALARGARPRFGRPG